MRLLFLGIVFLPLHSLSQDFTGVWTGFIFTSNVRLQYELVISETNDKLKGYSLTVFNINNTENTGIKTMKLKGKKGKISIEDDDLIFNDYSQRPKRVILYSTLSLEEEDSILVLQGSFFTRSLDRSTFTGTIRLEKSKNFSEARMIPLLRKMDLWDALAISESKLTEKNTSPVAAAPSVEPLIRDSTSVNPEMSTVTPKSVNKSDVASLPENKKEIIAIGPLPAGVAKPGMVDSTVAENISDSKPVNKSDVASLPDNKKEITAAGPSAGVTKPGVVDNTLTENIADPKPVNKSDVASLPEKKKEIIAAGPLPAGVAKPGMVDSTIAENIADPKPVNKSEVASLPELKKETITVGALPGGIAKPGVAARSVAEDIASRKTEIIRSIYVQSDSLILTLYDNGEIDGDTVSVVVNDKVIIARQVLGINAVNATVYVPRGAGDSIRLIMYAENLGRIPPNTGLLIVQDGDERYQIRFSGDYQKNSAVILRRKR